MADCSTICQLFSHLLLNAKVIDYSVTHQAATRLQHCMAETKDKVLVPLLTTMLDKVCHCVCDREIIPDVFLSRLPVLSGGYVRGCKVPHTGVNVRPLVISRCGGFYL